MIYNKYYKHTIRLVLNFAEYLSYLGNLILIVYIELRRSMHERNVGRLNNNKCRISMC